MNRAALVRKREGEHLHLGELMHAIEPSGSSACGTCLRSETMADPDQLQRQLLRFQNLVVVHPPERDLGGGDQVQFGVLDAVDLGLWTSWDEPNPMENIGIGHIGRRDGNKPLLGQMAYDKLLQSQLQKDRIALQKVESCSRNPSPCLEVDHVVLLAEFQVIFWLEIELGDRCGSPGDLEIRVVIVADRGRRMGHIRNARKEIVDLTIQGIVVFLRLLL